ncbi:hypothetical protein STEG23_028867 [Scotinomys teguina]
MSSCERVCDGPPVLGFIHARQALDPQHYLTSPQICLSEGSLGFWKTDALAQAMVVHNFNPSTREAEANPSRGKEACKYACKEVNKLWYIDSVKSYRAKKPVTKMIPGGLSDAKPATPEIQKITDQVRAQLEEKTNEKYEKFEAVQYKTQVVAGIHYFIKVNVGNDCYIHLKVFEGLNRQNACLELSGYQTDKTKDDEISYF